MTDIRSFLSRTHPFDLLDEPDLQQVVGAVQIMSFGGGEVIYTPGQQLETLFVIVSGEVELNSEEGEKLSVRYRGDLFGKRSVHRETGAYDTAQAAGEVTLYAIPARMIRALEEKHPRFAAHFGRKPQARQASPDLATMRVEDIMTSEPVSLSLDASAAKAARIMNNKDISCVLVTGPGGDVAGIITASDLSARVLAGGRSPETPLADIMTMEPVTLGPDALGIDVYQTMAERGIGHLPITGNESGKPIGIITRTTLLHHQSNLSPLMLVGRIARRSTIKDLQNVVAEAPKMLAQMVGSGASHRDVTRMVTSITDAVTKRLLVLAEIKLGPPPVPYLWLACGSQGRQEQTGISDQDNCLILSEEATPGDDAYFAALAKEVTDGLNACGFVYCPGDMMATNSRWRQKQSVWRSYYEHWINVPDPEAQMLASVMFDLRPIAGQFDLYTDIQADTFGKASKNSIFIGHMIGNSLKHTPPLSLFRGFALIREGEHKNSLDMKHNGVVPLVDLGRLYAIIGQSPEVNTRDRIEAAHESGVISHEGGRDLLDAYDFIAETRLKHQAQQIRDGEAPDNFLHPQSLSELERAYLKDAFMAVKTMQAAIGQGRGL